MEIRLVDTPITREELARIAREGFGELVKVVVDIEQEIMAVGGEMHAEEEVFLMERKGSKREHTWGINLYPDKSEGGWVEFDSMINLKPNLGNRSRGVESRDIQMKIKRIVQKLITN